MRQRGEVISEDGNIISVKLVNSAHSCGNCAGCIKLSNASKTEDQILELKKTHDDIRIGDQVIVEHSTRSLMNAIIALYGIPFLGLVCGYLLTYLIVREDPIAGLGALTGLIISVFIARPVARRVASTTCPVIVSRACS